MAYAIFDMPAIHGMAGVEELAQAGSEMGPPPAMTGAPRQAWSTPDSVNARQSLRLPGSGRPMATSRRLSASMTTWWLVEYR